MSSSNLNPAFLSNGDIKAGEFPDTYLNDVPRFHHYQADNFIAFDNLKFSGVKLAYLPANFSAATGDNLDNDEIRFNYDELDNRCEEVLWVQIHKVYKYKDLLDLVDGYANTKEYLLRALARNDFLWTKFLVACRSNSTPLKEENKYLEIELMDKNNLTTDEDQLILKYVEAVWSSLETLNWWENLLEWSSTTESLLLHTKDILERINRLPV